jgi:hypothetical protein
VGQLRALRELRDGRDLFAGRCRHAVRGVWRVQRGNPVADARLRRRHLHLGRLRPVVGLRHGRQLLTAREHPDSVPELRELRDADAVADVQLGDLRVGWLHQLGFVYGRGRVYARPGPDGGAGVRELREPDALAHLHERLRLGRVDELRHVYGPGRVLAGCDAPSGQLRPVLRGGVLELV